MAELADALSRVNVASQPVDMSRLEFPLVANEIAHGVPVGARIVDRGTGLAHFVLVCDCDDAAKTVTVVDPWGTVGTAAPAYLMPFLKFKNDYGGWGRCSHVFLVS